MRPSIFRRKFFIKKDLQGKYIFKYFLLFGLGSILFTLIFSFFSSNTLSIVYEDYRLQLGTTPGILMNRILSTQWILIVVGGILMMVVTLLLTHRIAGPFFRFETTLDEMIERNLSCRIFLRKKDEGKELGQKINELNRVLSADLVRLLENASQVQELLLDHSGKTRKGEDPGTVLVDRARELNQESLSLLGRYRLPRD
jgi:methyl-accepting chemotaxis protein